VYQRNSIQNGHILKPHGIKENQQSLDTGLFFPINKYVVPYLKSDCISTYSN